MNVLFFSSVPAGRYGGVLGWMRRLVPTLRDMGHEVHIFTWGRAPIDGSEWGPHFHFHFLNSSMLRLPVIRFWYTILETARAGRQLLNRQEIHIIHTVSHYQTLSASLARGAGSAAIVLSIHGDFVTEEDQWWRSRWRRRLHLPLESMAFHNCEVITTSSSWLRDRLASRFGSTRSVVIPNGIIVPPANIQWPSRQALQLPEDRKIILTLNNLFTVTRRQGLELLIAAAPAILKRIPDVLFLVVGGVNDPAKDRESLEWAHEHASGLPFIFTGYRPSHPQDLMVAADVYVHPSFLDNSPTSILEAMALSKPIVATQVGGIPEILSNGETGMLVPLEPSALADAVVHLLENRAHAAELGARAREKALSAFSWTRIGEQFTELYQEVFDRRRGSRASKSDERP